MKRQISLFLALTFLFGVLVSCENPEPTPEKLKKDCTVDYVTVSSSCECGIYNYFNRSVVVLDFRSEFYNESLPKSVTNTVNGVPTVLNYEKSWRNQYSAQSLYSSADEKVSYRYNFDTGKLDYVSINGYDMSAISDFSSEEDYISWCEKVLESYVEVDLDDYVYSCNTLISISHEDAAWNETRGGFISELSDTEKVHSYTFYFTKYFGDFKTSDEFSVTVYPDSNRLTVNLDAGQFSAFEEINIDTEEIEAAIDSFVKDNKRDGAFLKSYEISDRLLTFINGRMCVTYECNIDDYTNHGTYAIIAIFLN